MRLETGVADESRAYIAHDIAGSRLLIHAATLEYLRRGGRIGRAASMVGDVFGIRPVLHVKDGYVDGYAKVRGEKKALATMEKYVDENSTPDDKIVYATIDALDDWEPAMIDAMIRRMRPRAELILTTHVGAVVGTHIGPGSAAFAMIVE